MDNIFNKFLTQNSFNRNRNNVISFSVTHSHLYFINHQSLFRMSENCLSFGEVLIIKGAAYRHTLLSHPKVTPQSHNLQSHPPVISDTPLLP